MTAQTTSNARVLVVDDDPFFIDFIENSLKQHAIHPCQNGSSITKEDGLDDYDLVMMDIDLDGICGYELCRALRKMDKHVPVLFASGMGDLDARLKAYGAGGNDYIAKPFQGDELDCKVSALISQYQATKELKQELSQASSLVMGVQTDAANLQHVNRFILHSSQCKDMTTLYQIFFHTLHELGTEGILQVDGHEAIASNGHLSRLESEILEMACQLPRIYSFGKRRAYFGWRNCKLLIRNIGWLIDTIAILMDALEICIDRIAHERMLIDKVALLENYSHASKDAVASLFSAMTESISNELLMLGIVSSLNDDEEERIKSLMDSYNERVQGYLHEQDVYNQQLREAVDAMRQASPALSEFLAKISKPEEDSESVELF